MEKFYVHLLRMYEILNSGSSIQDLLDYAFKSFKDHISYDRIGLVLLDKNSNLYSFAVRADYTPQLQVGYSIEMRNTTLTEVINLKKPRIINNYIEYLKGKPHSESTKLLVSEGIRSSICYPLTTNNVSIGILLFSSRLPNAYTEKHIEFMRLIANSISIIIEKFLIVDDLVLSSIAGFAKLVEAKDCDTGSHIDRMQNYSRIIAQGLSKKTYYKGIITNKYIDDIYRFSPLHDIGKVGIADGILLKPAKLTHEEFEVMKRHTIIGANVLKEASNNSLNKDRHIFDIGIDIALGHHERFDGRGYPYGISGEDIPLSARIVSAADVLDALTSKRVYKQAIDIETSLDMMVGESGKMFDPNVIQVLIENKTEILDIYNRFRDQIEWSR